MHRHRQMSGLSIPGAGSSRRPVLLHGIPPEALPTLLYGVRLWVAVCFALYVAFRLELENAFWAGTTAAIVCQPIVGASLRKGWFRMVGTAIGAIGIVLLTAAFPQSAVGFLTCLALWGGICALVSTLLRNFAAYAAALAGYTAVVIAGDTLGATGGASNAVLQFAMLRTTEISIGIVCGTMVLAISDLGGARRQLGTFLGNYCLEIAHGIRGALAPQTPPDAGRTSRRALLLRVTGLGVSIDNAAGEISGIPFRPRVVQGAVEGLLGALSAWRLLATHREQRPDQTADMAASILHHVPAELTGGAIGTDRVARLRDECLGSARRLVAMPLADASGRLLADGLAAALLGLARTLGTLAWLEGYGSAPATRRYGRPAIPDMLPPLINAMRAFLTIAAAELIWITTAWPSGGTMVVFAAVAVILFSPREDAAFDMAWRFLLGTIVAAALAAVVGFAILPAQSSFWGFSLALGLVLVPAGALSGQTWQQPVFVAMATNFVPLLAPSNAQGYDPEGFYNAALALVAGVCLAVFAMRLLPPLPQTLRANRLLRFTLRDLRRDVCGPRPITEFEWERRIYGRLVAMPPQVEPLQPARMIAALAVGAALIRLRRHAAVLHMTEDLLPTLDALSGRDPARAIVELARLDTMLQTASAGAARRRRLLRVRGAITIIAEALRVHADYFAAEAHR